MTGIRRFEDIEAWKHARVLAKRIYEITLAGQWTRDFGLRDQVRRSAVSVMSNVAEGFGRNGDTEFIRFLNISRGSLAELKSQLYLASDLGYIDEATFAELCNEVDLTAGIIAGLTRYLRRPASQQT